MYSIMEPLVNSSPAFLIAGLGNPGREYKASRHNIGFMLVSHLAEELGVTFSRVQSKALVTKTEYQGSRLILAKPQTYMISPVKQLDLWLSFTKLNLITCW